MTELEKELVMVKVGDLAIALSILRPSIPVYSWLLPLAVYLTIISFLRMFLPGLL